MKNSRNGPTTVGVNVDETLARTCLAQATRTAVGALKNDGVITQSEGGPLPDRDDEYTYIRTGYVSTKTPLGTANYYGLCDPEGPNKQQNGVYFCEPSLYQPGSKLSIQEQLQTTISQSMSKCIEQPAQAEVIIQDDSLLVRWEEPEIQHTERTPLLRAWLAIEEIVRKETSNPYFTPDQDTLQCNGCASNVDIQKVATPKTATYPYDAYKVVVDGGEIATILFENRIPLLIHDVAGIESITQYYAEETCTSAPCEYQFLFADGDIVTTTVNGQQDLLLTPGVEGFEELFTLSFDPCDYPEAPEYEVDLSDGVTNFVLRIHYTPGCTT